MTSLSIILTVFVLQLHHVGPHQKPVPRWLRALVFDLLARMVCMGRASTFMKNRTYGKCENMYLSTFMENAEGGNCNGSVPLSGVTISHERIDHTGEVITKHIRGLVSRQDNDESHQDLIQEWQFVAHVIDRLLFWIFLFFAVVSSLTILVIKPLLKPEPNVTWRDVTTSQHDISLDVKAQDWTWRQYWCSWRKTETWSGWVIMVSR